jgi:hypothetical protein
MMSSLSESALPAGFFSLLSSDPGDSDLNQDLDALSLEIRTDWCRGRLSRSLIFEVTQRVRDHRASDLIGCDDDGGISCCDSVEEFIDGLLREVVDTAVETAEADQRDRILCGLLGPYACAPLLDRQEIQQVPVPEQSFF